LVVVVAEREVLRPGDRQSEKDENWARRERVGERTGRDVRTESGREKRHRHGHGMFDTRLGAGWLVSIGTILPVT
jgi:hypothetical protein